MSRREQRLCCLFFSRCAKSWRGSAPLEATPKAGAPARKKKKEAPVGLFVCGRGSIPSANLLPLFDRPTALDLPTLHAGDVDHAKKQDRRKAGLAFFLARARRESCAVVLFLLICAFFFHLCRQRILQRIFCRRGRAFLWPRPRWTEKTARNTQEGERRKKKSRTDQWAAGSTTTASGCWCTILAAPTRSSPSAAWRQSAAHA